MEDYGRWKADRDGDLASGNGDPSTSNVHGPPPSKRKRKIVAHMKEPRKPPSPHMLSDHMESILKLAAFFKIIFARSVREADISLAMQYYQDYLSWLYRVSALLAWCFMKALMFSRFLPGQ